MAIKDYLHRYWIEIDTSEFDEIYLQWRIGVTAFDYDDALGLIRKHLLVDRPMPLIIKVIEDIDVSTLDDKHLRRNVGIPVWRGIWYPLRVYED